MLWSGHRRGRATPTARRRSASRSTAEPRARVPDRGGRHPLRRRPAAAVPARLRLRQRALPAGACRRCRSPASRSWSRAGAIRRCPRAGPLGGFHWIAASSTRGVGQRRARRSAAPVELERRRRRRPPGPKGLGGDGRGEFLTARTTAGGYAVRGPAHLPRRRRQPGGVPRQEPHAPVPDRVRPGARAALRRRDPRPIRPPTPRTGAIRSGCRCRSRCRRRA